MESYQAIIMSEVRVDILEGIYIGVVKIYIIKVFYLKEEGHERPSYEELFQVISYRQRNLR